jgi:ABC-type glycerol-3-phosphate transport system substrate-binding protein
MKRILLVCVTLGLLLSIPAFSGGQKESEGGEAQEMAAKEPVELVIWRGRLGTEWDTFQGEIAQEFEKKFPHVKVAETVFPWNKLREKNFTAFQVGGEMPDIIFEGMNLIGSYAKAGGLEPLDPWLEKWSDTKKFPKSVWQAASYEDKVYGAPWGAIPYVTLYNTEMFDTTAVKPPRNWADWLAISEKLTKPDENRYAWAVRTDRLLNSFFTELLWQNGGGLFTTSDRGPGAAEDVAINSPKALEALNELLKRASYAPGGIPGNVGLKGPDVVGLFAGEQIAMINGAIHQYGQALTLGEDIKGKIGAFVNPGHKEDVSFVIGQTLVMTSGTKDKEMAWEYLKLSMSKEWETERCIRMGYAPFRSDVDDPEIMNHPAIPAGIKAVKQAVMQPDFPEWLEYRNVLKNELEAVFLEQKSPQEGLDFAAAELKKLLGM